MHWSIASDFDKSGNKWTVWLLKTLTASTFSSTFKKFLHHVYDAGSMICICGME